MSEPALQASESTAFKVNKAVHGDVTIGIWLGNHKRDRDVPAFAYQFHTALLDTGVCHASAPMCRPAFTPQMMRPVVKLLVALAHAVLTVRKHVLLLRSLAGIFAITVYHTSQKCCLCVFLAQCAALLAALTWSLLQHDFATVTLYSILYQVL